MVHLGQDAAKGLRRVDDVQLAAGRVAGADGNLVTVELGEDDGAAGVPPPPVEAPPARRRLLPGLAAAAEAVEDVVEEPPPAVEDACKNRRSLLCRRQAWTRFEAAYRRRDCAAMLSAYARLVADDPDLLGTADTVAAFAEAHLECAGKAGAGAREKRLRRAVELLAGFAGGELWCRGRESRLLARAYEELGDPAAAAASAGAARTRCAAAETAGLEWEFYFRVQLAETCTSSCDGMAELSAKSRP